jgi:hypothetical protein
MIHRAQLAHPIFASPLLTLRLYAVPMSRLFVIGVIVVFTSVRDRSARSNFISHISILKQRALDAEVLRGTSYELALLVDPLPLRRRNAAVLYLRPISDVLN